jgi:hypothetical protein
MRGELRNVYKVLRGDYCGDVGIIGMIILK